MHCQVIRLYILNINYYCQLYLNKPGEEIAFKESVNVLKNFNMAKYWQFSIDGHDRSLLYYFLDISCMFEILSQKRKWLELKNKIFQLPTFLVLALSQIRQSTMYVTRPTWFIVLFYITYLFQHCKHSATSSPSKMKELLAEVGNLVTSTSDCCRLFSSVPTTISGW